MHDAPRVHSSTGIAAEAGVRDGAQPWPAWAWSVAAVALIALLVLLAYAGRVLVDDAFISFRYARNLVEGVGLVYNSGERVEGYTNFLWVMLIAGGMKLGLDPARTAVALGLALHAAMLALTWRMAQRVLGDGRWCLAVVLLIGAQYTVLTFATGGLETSLQTFLLIGGCALVIGRDLDRTWRMGDFLLLSVLCAAGVLTRMDFALFAGVLAIAAVLSWRRSGGWETATGRPRFVTCLAALIVPAAAIVCCWLLWKWSYYGSIFPNTYYAKRPGPHAATHGLRYIWVFVSSYLYIVPAAVVAVGCVELVRRRHILLLAPSIILLWLAYIVRVGGDFIEFRFLAPVVPLFMLTLVWSLRWLVERFTLARILLVHLLVMGWTVAGSVRHWGSYSWDPDRPEPVYQLARQIDSARWVESGESLRRYFPGGHVVIATSAAGALPYYSRLPTIDILGLNDRHIAMQGEVFSDRPGHQRRATVDYLRQRAVHLVIGHPQPFIAPALDHFVERYLGDFAKARQIPPGGVVVMIPVADGFLLPAWYLTPSAEVDAAIAEGGWRTFVIGAAPSLRP